MHLQPASGGGSVWRDDSEPEVDARLRRAVDRVREASAGAYIGALSARGGG